MAGLDDINPNDPAGNETPTLGDNRIRALAAKIIEAFEVEHNLAGPHTILVGSSAQRPAAGYAGRIYILTAAGVAVELQYDTGSAWVSLTSNQTIIDYAAGLAVHIAASPIDHPNGSVTQIKIAPSAILKKHLDGSGDNTTLENLVNGGNADTFHVHASTDQNLAVFTSSGIWTCPDGIILVLFEGSGGAGGGGGRNGLTGGSGGGGGGYIKGYCAVVPGTDYAVTIGLGGAGGTLNVNGLAGAQTLFEGLIAYGGGGGKRNGGAGGVGGGFTVGDGFYGGYGVTGGVGDGAGGGTGGKGGPACAYGGGFGGAGGIQGIGGNIPGGGGGGGYTGVSDAGGSGARGLAILSW
jgi:hypothetical protein